METQLVEQLSPTQREELNPPLFYYDKQTSVCLLMNTKGEPMARGIAICSPLDPFEKRIGRAKALGRAIQALIKQDTNGWINPHRFDERKPGIPRTKQEEIKIRLRNAAYTYGWKSAFHPTLTDLEKQLLNGSKLYATIK